MKDFHCYFDESGTHKSSAVIIVGGLVGDAAQFAQFTRRLDEIRGRYGFKVFHAVEFRNGDGEFRGWPPEKKLALAIELSNLVAETMTAGAVATLVRDDYNRCYRADTSQPKVPKDSAYGLCFRMCLVDFLQEIQEAYPYETTPYTVHVVVEDGDPNVGNAKVIFEEIRATMLAKFKVDPLGTFRVAAKSQCLELMLADFLAYTEYMRQNSNPGENPLTAEEVAELESHAAKEQKARLSYLSLGSEQLNQLSEHFANLRRLRNYTNRQNSIRSKS